MSDSVKTIRDEHDRQKRFFEDCGSRYSQGFSDGIEFTILQMSKKHPDIYRKVFGNE